MLLQNMINKLEKEDFVNRIVDEAKIDFDLGGILFPKM